MQVTANEFVLYMTIKAERLYAQVKFGDISRSQWMLQVRSLLSMVAMIDHYRKAGILKTITFPSFKNIGHAFDSLSSARDRMGFVDIVDADPFFSIDLFVCLQNTWHLVRKNYIDRLRDQP